MAGSAEPPRFKVGGQWTAFQSNRSTATFHLKQDDNGTLTGDGEQPTASATTSSGGTLRGRVEGGRVEGNSFVVTIDWDPIGPDVGPRGEYSGTFNPEGRLTGLAYDINNPGSQAFWFSGGSFPRA